MKTISVISTAGKPLQPTYVKRARQLVKNNRAAWEGKALIRMLDFREEKSVEYENNGNVYSEPERRPVPAPLDDRVVMDMAKRRVLAKKNLFGQLLDYILLGIVMLGIVNTHWFEDRMGVTMGFLFFWGVRLAWRAWKFARPAFSKGFVQYFREREQRRLEAEYMRLKKMDAAYVSTRIAE